MTLTLEVNGMHSPSDATHKCIMDLCLSPRDGLLYNFIESDKEKVRPADTSRQSKGEKQTDAEHHVLARKRNKKRRGEHMTTSSAV